MGNENEDKLKKEIECETINIYEQRGVESEATNICEQEVVFSSYT